MTDITYTNTSLATARRCLCEYDLAYLQRLERDTDRESEALAVGSTWHKAHDVAASGGDPYDAIRVHAPSELWATKLACLFAAYGWYWQDQTLDLVKSEETFRVKWGDYTFEGQMDGLVRLEDGRLCLLERKTTSDGLGAESLYWNRLRLDVQVGLYALACESLPSAILYDVVRKPTINPKNLVKKDVERMEREFQGSGDTATYFGTTFREDQIRSALDEKRESLEMYAARLTADIGDRPDWYFARREVPRSQQDYQELLKNLADQVWVIEHAQDRGKLHRNPDACATFGLCRFFGLCSNNVRPRAGEDPPNGFRRREHLHPELASELN